MAIIQYTGCEILTVYFISHDMPPLPALVAYNLNAKYASVFDKAPPVLLRLLSAKQTFFRNTEGPCRIIEFYLP